MFLNIICENFYIPINYNSGFLFTFASIVHFLARDGCFCLTNKFLQVSNNQLVYPVNGELCQSKPSAWW